MNNIKIIINKFKNNNNIFFIIKIKYSMIIQILKKFINLKKYIKYIYI